MFYSFMHIKKAERQKVEWQEESKKVEWRHKGTKWQKVEWTQV